MAQVFRWAVAPGLSAALMSTALALGFVLDLTRRRGGQGREEASTSVLLMLPFYCYKIKTSFWEFNFSSSIPIKEIHLFAEIIKILLVQYVSYVTLYF